ncbi:protein crowded nuclei 2 [Tanacetum coccineum]
MPGNAVAGVTTPKALMCWAHLFDYQYNMGLLLIENKELTANTEELREALSATQETVKREEAAHFMAVSEVEKRADNLRRSLELEYALSADAKSFFCNCLEKALREIDEENKQVQLRSQTKLAEANSLVAGIGDKAREVEEKMLQADEKLAEANRKTLELERKCRVTAKMLEHFIVLRDAWEDTYSRHKEDLREWERKLHEGEERLCEGRRIINSREEKVNEIESLEALKSKTENIRNEITLKELHVKEEIESLKIAEEERATFSCLQSKLKDEREACRLEKEFIMKERDDLRNDRVKFEVEWEALDENRLVIAKELKEFNEQKENWERRQETELGKLEKEKRDMKEYIKRELEAVKLERDTFVATMKHEESLLVAKYDNEHRIFLHELVKEKSS